MRCSKCGVENPDRAKFCVECASPFARRCPTCDAENPATAKFCLECGKALDSTGGKSQRGRGSSSSPIQTSVGTDDASLEGERKTVTVLFADIKGSMDLIEDLDPEEARAIVDPALFIWNGRSARNCLRDHRYRETRVLLSRTTGLSPYMHRAQRNRRALTDYILAIE